MAKVVRHGIVGGDLRIQAKNRWGSCTGDSHILMNPELIVAPKACIEYVIAHESCLLKEHNHGPTSNGSCASHDGGL